MSKSSKKSTKIHPQAAAAVPSVEDRLKRVSDALVIVSECLVWGDGESLDDDTVRTAIWNLTHAAVDDAYWLQQLPRQVLKMPAPTTDEAEAAGGGR